MSTRIASTRREGKAVNAVLLRDRPSRSELNSILFAPLNQSQSLHLVVATQLPRATI